MEKKKPVRRKKQEVEHIEAQPTQVEPVKLTPLTVQIPVELRDKFRKLAIICDTTMTELIREYVEDIVEENKELLTPKRTLLRKPPRKKKGGEENG